MQWRTPIVALISLQKRHREAPHSALSVYVPDHPSAAASARETKAFIPRL